MPNERSGYVNVNELMPQVQLDQVAAFYGVALGELHRIGNEVRTRCFLACGKTEETGGRALAIQADHPAKIWHCHQYGCGRSGNLVSLCHLLKPGGGGESRPRGERFKEIARDLQAMAGGGVRPAAESRPAAEEAPSAPKRATRNLPLRESPNERARGLITLDEKFVLDPAAMPPKAAAYFLRRPFLSPEACRKWRMGYLPRDSGGNQSGGTMRGKIVYPILSETGEVLTWFGRDPEFEEKRERWLTGGKVDREPEKFHFVKGFHRGLELFGQHGSRLREPGYRERIAELGIIVVEGPNDVIALDALGAPAVALCSNTATREQVEKLTRWADHFAGGRVTLMLDCDAEGESGAKQALWELAEHCSVRLAWSSEMHGGRFKGGQPERLRAENWSEISEYLIGDGA